MGSLVVKIDGSTKGILKNVHHYSDLDVLTTTSGSGGGAVPMVYDVEAVKASVRNILMWRVGENVIRPQFGHNIHRSMYEQLDQFNKEKVCAEVQRAIQDNEPRVNIQSVKIMTREEGEDYDEDNALKIRVVYEVIGDKAAGAQIVEDATIQGI